MVEVKLRELGFKRPCSFHAWDPEVARWTSLGELLEDDRPHAERGLTDTGHRSEVVLAQLAPVEPQLTAAT